MPAAAKPPFSSKNPATVAKKLSAGAAGAITGAGQGGEVVCPLPNSDGSTCRKKCVGNFAYRSICEHIRRAHPDNWIPKLPASPETFAKMIGLTPKSGFTVRKTAPTTAPRRHMKYELFIEGMSSPSSANESDTLASISVSANPTAFHSKFPPAYNNHDFNDDDEDDDLDGEHEIDHDMDFREHSETETEDEDRMPSPYPSYSHHHHHHHHHPRAPSPPLSKELSIWGNIKNRSAKRKRCHSGAVNSSQFNASRWDELIEAATTRAVVEGSPENFQPPPSPPPTASSNPYNDSRRASSNATTSPIMSNMSFSSASFSPSKPRVQCSACPTVTPLHLSFACTECISGFCAECALTAGKKGVCSECRALGGKFKPVKIIIKS